MNKYYIDAVIVVEGKSDVSYLSSFIIADYFITNGYDLNDEKIEFLNRVASIRKVICLTDNDDAGILIENKLKNKINGVIALKTRKITRKNYKKSGVAETTKEEILSVLSSYISTYTEENVDNNYNLASIISLSKNPSEIKSQIINDYRLMNGNNKFLENQLKMLKVNAKVFKEKYGN